MRVLGSKLLSICFACLKGIGHCESPTQKEKSEDDLAKRPFKDVSLPAVNAKVKFKRIPRQPYWLDGDVERDELGDFQIGS
jgi:hypothetical protein